MQLHLTGRVAGKHCAAFCLAWPTALMA